MSAAVIGDLSHDWVIQKPFFQLQSGTQSIPQFRYVDGQKELEKKKERCTEWPQLKRMYAQSVRVYFRSEVRYEVWYMYQFRKVPSTHVNQKLNQEREMELQRTISATYTHARLAASI